MIVIDGKPGSLPISLAQIAGGISMTIPTAESIEAKMTTSPTIEFVTSNVRGAMLEEMLVK